MNVFKIEKSIRKVGYGYGTPCLSVEFGLGVSYEIETLLRKLIDSGLVEKSWVVLKGGLTQKGVGTLVDALSYIHCRVEVEARGRDTTPGWFPRAHRWTVWWDGFDSFNFTALRRGQDMAVAEAGMLTKFVETLGSNDLVDKGCIVSDDFDWELVSKHQIRAYEEVGP